METVTDMDIDSTWNGIEGIIKDEEEIKVLFSALDSYLQYGKSAHFNCTHLRRRNLYALPEATWKMLAAPPFNYLEMLDRVDDAIESNAELAQTIVKTGLQSFHIAPTADVQREMCAGPEAKLLPRWTGCAGPSDVNKARTTLRQFYRDWSAAGAPEREACYGPVMRTLVAEKTARGPDRGPFTVLVPGAGLGRLVYELAMNGFEAEGNDLSYHMMLASAYILNVCEGASKHMIYPWVHSFSHHKSRENHLRGYPVPDIHCATELGKRSGTGNMSMCAADFLCLYSDEEHANRYDAIACVFFLDTAPNLARYLQTMLHCLRPGGLLVNFGPLVWHFEGSVPQADEGETDTAGVADPGQFELCDDEVLLLVQKMGFDVLEHQTDIEAPYIQDPQSMMPPYYKATFWVARKA